MPDLTSVEIAQIRTSDDVARQLDTLSKQLPGSTLATLTTFNDAYAVVTRVINSSRAHTAFAEPVLLDKFVVIFARYYFQAINDLLAGEANVPAAWREAARPVARRPVFISLLLGASAHINYDLPLVLAEVITDPREARLPRDLLKIDRLLLRSGRQILATFHEPSRWLDFLKRRTRVIYFRPVMYVIFGWRIRAWRNYRRAPNGGLEAAAARRSAKGATRLSRLGSLLTKLP